MWRHRQPMEFHGPRRAPVRHLRRAGPLVEQIAAGWGGTPVQPAWWSRDVRDGSSWKLSKVLILFLHLKPSLSHRIRARFLSSLDSLTLSSSVRSHTSGERSPPPLVHSTALRASWVARRRPKCSFVSRGGRSIDRFYSRVRLYLGMAPAGRCIFTFASIYEVFKQQNKEINKVIIITFKSRHENKIVFL
jgi:hypothetical protein